MIAILRLSAILVFFFSSSAPLFAQIPYQTSQFWQSGEPNMYSTGMIWRDCNGDGYIDVFFSNGNDIVLASNTIYISNEGTLPISATWFSDNREYSGHCGAGDIDDDGWPDFAVANYLGSGGFSTANLSNLYYNNGGLPNTSPDWHTGDSIYTFSCAFGDADGDGDLDLAFATGDGYNDINITDRIYYNVDGALEALPSWETAAGSQALDVAWGDVDNDGDLDIAFCYDNLPPAVYENHRDSIGTVPDWQSIHNESANTLMFGDVDGDGWLDLIVAFNNQLGGTGYYRVYYNDGAGTLNTASGWNSGTGGYGSALALYDYDNDGDLDLAAGRWFDRLRIYPNDNGVFSTNPEWRATPSTVAEELAFVDIDGDGVEIRADTIYDVADKKVFYTAFEPLHAIDSVMVDGSILTLDQYCYDLFSGWVSLGQAPADSIIVFYEYSFKCDLTVSHWDTYNMAFANTNPPLVAFDADTTFGFVPLPVTFTDNSIDATDWRWRFGDGSVSTDQNPVHLYEAGGAFDVHLEALLPDDWHNHLKRRMIITLADTLIFPTIAADPGDTVVVPLDLINAHPLNRFVVAMTFTGTPQLDFIDFSTDGCRTAYFSSVEIVGGMPETYQLAFDLTSGVETGNPPLAPGSGTVLNLRFVAIDGPGTAVLDTVSVSAQSTWLHAEYVSYQPYVIAGSVSTGFLCGDCDGSGAVNVADAVHIVNYVFKGGPPPDPPESGDVNIDGSVNIADAVYIIAYVFGGGPEPCNP